MDHIYPPLAIFFLLRNFCLFFSPIGKRDLSALGLGGQPIPNSHGSSDMHSDRSFWIPKPLSGMHASIALHGSTALWRMRQILRLLTFIFFFDTQEDFEVDPLTLLLIPRRWSNLCTLSHSNFFIFKLNDSLSRSLSYWNVVSLSYLARRLKGPLSRNALWHECGERMRIKKPDLYGRSSGITKGHGYWCYCSAPRKHK